MASQLVYSRSGAPAHLRVTTSNRSFPGKVSLDRVNDFLLNTELLDVFTPRPAELPIQAPPSFDENAIGFNNASFSWSADSSNGSLTPNSRNFRLCIDNEALFKPGCINMIVGPTYDLFFSRIVLCIDKMQWFREDIYTHGFAW